MTIEQNITHNQGDSRDFVFTIEDAVGDPFDLTGFDARLQVRRTYGNTNTLINATLSNSKLLISSPGTGVVIFRLAPADTSGIRFNAIDDETLECVYDLEVQSSGGLVFKPARGTFTLVREVTR